jgi:DNA-binding transcriptional LysR family regulator
LKIDLAALKLFVRADERGSISAAARELGWLPATASAALMRAEQELGGKLFTRTTRSLKPTPDGERFLERARQALETLDEAREVFLSGKQAVQGLIRLSAPFDVGEQVLLPALDAFLDKHAGVQLALQLSDQFRDLWRDDFDAAIRYGLITDANLIVRKLAETRRILVAAPRYLERRGTPRRVEDLAEHECVLLKTSARSADVWPLLRGRRLVEVKVRGRRLSDNGAVTRRWAVGGHGIALKSWIDVCEDIARRRLVRVLPEISSESYPIMLATSSGIRMVGRMRALGDWLAERFALHIQHHPFPD